MGRNKYSLETRQSLLVNGQVKEYVHARKEMFKGNYEPLEIFKDNYGLDIVKACKSVSDSKYRKRKNIEKRFNAFVESGKAIFVTLTFSNDTLNRTKEEIRRKYVQRYLKEQCLCFVANIDYGDKVKNPDSNEREHYHALVIPRNETVDMESWKGYGHILVKKVHTGTKDIEKVSKYVSKLSQHALKECTKIPRLIWSRGWKR